MLYRVHMFTIYMSKSLFQVSRNRQSPLESDIEFNGSMFKMNQISIHIYTYGEFRRFMKDIRLHVEDKIK